jgi:hypothetical protein
MLMLRDHYAMAALPTMIKLLEAECSKEQITDECFRYASAMIASRSKHEQGLLKAESETV